MILGIERCRVHAPLRGRCGDQLRAQSRRGHAQRLLERGQAGARHGQHHRPALGLECGQAITGLAQRIVQDRQPVGSQSGAQCAASTASA
jgi:hypothetical protein